MFTLNMSKRKLEGSDDSQTVQVTHGRPSLLPKALSSLPQFPPARSIQKLSHKASCHTDA